MNAILSTDDYKPDYIERKPERCPHCGHHAHTRTNRYLFRCNNFLECGRYF